ncbi:hypothetical protein F8388_027133 [Cannabis sativa]|uniref:Uncharacterized protein n=1 Tax=Cannabis sativa TaxID=3483 RepID=A0A7J6FRL0_CANSA|nr:hypothetical protein F8388_027133 [Cannabis sativa]
MSSFCRAMELKNCCNTNINGYERIMFCSVLLFPSGSRWKMLWTKIMKEKKKILIKDQPLTPKMSPDLSRLDLLFHQGFSRRMKWEDKERIWIKGFKSLF